MASCQHQLSSVQAQAINHPTLSGSTESWRWASDPYRPVWVWGWSLAWSWLQRKERKARKAQWRPRITWHLQQIQQRSRLWSLHGFSGRSALFEADFDVWLGIFSCQLLVLGHRTWVKSHFFRFSKFCGSLFGSTQWLQWLIEARSFILAAVNVLALVAFVAFTKPVQQLMDSNAATWRVFAEAFLARTFVAKRVPLWLWVRWESISCC